MITYEPMTVKDCDTVTTLYVDYYNKEEEGSWDFARAKKRIHQMITMEDSICYLQKENGILCGIILAYLKPFDDIDVLQVDEIVIAKAYQNKGYGTKLIQEIEKIAKGMGAKLMQLESVNDAAHDHFYTQCGFYHANNLVLMGKEIK
jgi:aminoglycoside 6'-N-acetyltransferase I